MFERCNVSVKLSLKSVKILHLLILTCKCHKVLSDRSQDDMGPGSGYTQQQDAPPSQQPQDYDGPAGMLPDGTIEVGIQIYHWSIIFFAVKCQFLNFKYMKFFYTEQLGRSL